MCWMGELSGVLDGWVSGVVCWMGEWSGVLDG